MPPSRPGAPPELPPDALTRRYEPDLPPFRTTADLPDVVGLVGQPRAAAAVAFGTGIGRPGFNIFAFGLPGTGKRSFLRQHLEMLAAREPTPPDLCYVHDFDAPHRPRLLTVPAGRGAELRRDLERLGDELRVAVAAALDSEEYQRRRQLIEDEVKQRPERRLQEIGERARASGLALLRTPAGLSFVPVRDDQVVTDEQLAALPEEERRRIEADVERLQQEVEQTLRQIPRWNRERRERVRALNRDVTGLALEHPIAELRERYADLPPVLAHLEAVQQHALEHARELAAGESAPGPGGELLGRSDAPGVQRLYQVNLLVDNAGRTGAPVIYEDNPIYENLVGRVEHAAQFGALVTDFSLVKAGALHRASGGYLLLDMHKLLRSPFAWDGLKRALAARQIRIESVSQALGLVGTVSLEPEPVDLHVQVVLMGDPSLYYLVHTLDPDFAEHFKVAADFDEAMEATGERIGQYAALLATLARQESVRPLDRSAVARVMEHAARLAEDQRKLSARIAIVLDLLREADFWARQEERDAIGARHVERAIEAQLHRADRPRQRYLEALARGVMLIDTDGERVGQVNALAAATYGTFTFAYPSRVTARVRPGGGQVLDIEREVELGGPIHSKGVLILGGYLGARYAAEHPLALGATLVFEQSYGGVEGDSASAAELFALLSAIGEVPLTQAIAVTGSVNQHGDIQPIGAVNEKVEGFFDACRGRGLTGRQGVIIPRANAAHLMLRRDVIEAVGRGEFHLYSIATVDQGLTLLAGLPAGQPDATGAFPAGSVNGRIAARLAAFARIRRAFGGRDETE